MKQTRLLSEISRLSEYTRLYSIHFTSLICHNGIGPTTVSNNFVTVRDIGYSEKNMGIFASSWGILACLLQTLPRGGGGVAKYKKPNNLWFSWGRVRTPFPPLDPRMKTHSSDVLLMVWRCACHVLWTLSSNYFLCHFFMNLWSIYRLVFAF